MQRIAINGFGRIGRNVLRAWFEHPQGYDFQIVAINDIADAETLLHLLKYDTTHGRFAGQADLIEDNGQRILKVSTAQKSLDIQLLQHPDPVDLPWADTDTAHGLNVDVVLECTGLFRSRADAGKHLQAGAKRVIIGAAPFDSVDAAVVYGINHQDIKATDQIISSVSCTTQALVPLVKIMDDAFGIDTALMTEIHAVTADQSVLDHAHRDLRRARASGQNIIPTTSSALGALKQVMPHMEHRIDGYSIRVPTINVAAIDLTFVANSFDKNSELNRDVVNQKLINASTNQFSEIMQTTNEFLVSSDFNHSPYSLIVDLTQTMVIGRQVKVFAWYDNEWGYANRLLDLCATI